MTTNGPKHDSQPHPHRSRVTSDEEHPCPPSTDNGGSHSEPDPDRGRHLLRHHPPTLYASTAIAYGHSVRGLTLKADTGDDLARVHDGWTVAPDGGLCGPNGKVWHP